MSVSTHRLDLLAKLLELRATDHPTTGPVILGDDNSEENYELDAVLEALVRRLIDCEHRTADALWQASLLWKREADRGILDVVRAYVKEAGL